MKSTHPAAWHIAARLTFVFVCVVPFITPGQSANAGVIVDSAKSYIDELIIVGCIVFLALGTLLGMVYPDDEKLKPLSIKIKVLSSLFLGLGAFVYVLQHEKQLTPLNALWTGGVAFIAPAIIGIVRQLAIVYAKAKAGVLGRGNAE